MASRAPFAAIVPAERSRGCHESQRQSLSDARRAAVHQLLQRAHDAWRQLDAAVALGTAACVAGNDPVKMLRLPFTDGMVNRVIIPKTQRFSYDQAVRMIGCNIVEIETREDLDRALAEPVAMVVLLGEQEHLTGVRLEEIAAVVKPRGIPIMVDAASEHIERPSPWLVRGADLVIYSGGKFLRGPQTSRLLLRNTPLVPAGPAH